MCCESADALNYIVCRCTMYTHTYSDERNAILIRNRLSFISVQNVPAGVTAYKKTSSQRIAFAMMVNEHAIDIKSNVGM